MAKLIIGDSPCAKCGKEENDGCFCKKWEAWYKATWRRLRRHFGYLGVKK